MQILTVAPLLPPQAILPVRCDDQLDVLIHHRLSNICGDQHRNLLPIYLLTIQLDSQLVVAECALNTLLALAHPAALRPFDLVDPIGFWCPVRQLLESCQSSHELVAVARAVFGWLQFRNWAIPLRAAATAGPGRGAAPWTAVGVPFSQGDVGDGGLPFRRGR